MAMNPIPAFPALVSTTHMKLVNGDGTGLKTLLTPGANGTKITAIGVSSDDTSTRDISLWVTISGVDYLLGTKTIPVTAGFITGTPAFSFFDGIQMPWVPIDSDGQRYLLLMSGAVLKVKTAVAVTAAKGIYFYVNSQDF